MVKNSKPNNSIRIGIRDFAGWTIVVIAIVSMYFMSKSLTRDMSNTIIQSGHDGVESKAAQCATDIGRLFESKFDLLKYVSTISDVRSMNYDSQKKFMMSNSKGMGFKSTFVVTLAGQGYYYEENMVKDQSAEPFFKNLMSKEQYVTDPFCHKDSEENRATLCQGMYVDVNDEKMRIGTVCGVIDLTDLYENISKMNESDDKIFVINSEGKYIVSENMQKVSDNKTINDDYSKYPEFIDFVLSKGIDKAESKEFELKYGKKYIVSTATVDYSGWKVCIIHNTQEIMNQLDNLVRTQYFVMALLLLLLAFIINNFVRMIIREKRLFSDPLTGVANRARCNMALDKVETIRKEDVMLVSFDLNDFKKINDNLGHDVGDEALKDFAKVLDSSFGRKGFVGRMGGDEFIAILSGDVTKKFESSESDMKHKIEELNNRENVKYKLSPSYGFAIRSAVRSYVVSVDELYKEADKKMYEYKAMIKAEKI